MEEQSGTRYLIQVSVNGFLIAMSDLDGVFISDGALIISGFLLSRAGFRLAVAATLARRDYCFVASRMIRCFCTPHSLSFSVSRLS